VVRAAAAVGFWGEGNLGRWNGAPRLSVRRSIAAMRS
jgi:hypothetical protein